MRHGRVVIAIALFTLLVHGCPKSAPPPSGPGPGGEFDERQACTVDRDCAAVEIACCDYCNGGTPVGVHKDHAADVGAEYRAAARCEGVACTAMACEPLRAVCRNQICGVVVNGAEQVTPLPRP